MHASLITTQANPTVLHSFPTTFCVMNNQPAPRPLVPPSILILTTVEILEEKEEEKSEEENEPDQLQAGDEDEGEDTADET